MLVLVPMLGAVGGVCVACSSPATKPHEARDAHVFGDPSLGLERATAASASSASSPSSSRKPGPAAPPASTWAEVTRSPSPDEAPHALAARCGVADAALGRAAGELARGGADRDVDQVLRRQGIPYVRPRVVRASGADRTLLLQRLGQRLEAERRPATRCGVHETVVEGQASIVVVAVNALADLDPVPVRGRTGGWVELSATLDRKMTAPFLFVLGPRGAPHTVPVAMEAETGRVRARFALAQPGAFRVQLLAQGNSGTEPVLEARVFADVAPFDDEDPTTPAPGEEALSGTGNDDADAIVRATNLVRAGEGLATLRRNPTLERVAQEHAEAMRAAQKVAHDTGDGRGDAVSRLNRIDFTASVVGENVAGARDVARAHRALHASPSHRGNLLHPRYTDVGVGIARDPSAGRVYVTQLFARIP